MTESLFEDGESTAAALPARTGPLRLALDWLPARLAAERGRWGLWLPVAMGTGNAAYFALPTEPPGWAGALAAGVLALVAVAVRRRPEWLVPAMALVAVAAGFAAGQARTASVAAPMLQREIGPVTVTGRVEAIDRLEAGVRLVLVGPAVERLAPAATPHRVRVRLAAKHGQPLPGATVRLRAILHPPPRPPAPGAYDFQRHAFFEGIGGVGYALGPPETVAPPPESGWAAFTAAMEALRGHIAERVAAAVDDPADAGITTALLNGEQTGIPEPAMQAMRDSGLAHLLSISGLHIGLVAGLVFFAVRALLALAEPVALRWSIKKIAAVCGLLAAVGYTLVVGGPVPTLRSVLMTGLALVAVLVDRDPFSMRLVAFAAVVVILAAPDAMLGPSFQMSFAAVVALIAAYEVMSPRIAGWRAGLNLPGRAALYLGGVALTSVVATAATTPFSLFHFQSVAFYGVVANMAAVPITSFWVMPWSLVAYALMPLGWDGPALTAMGWGVTAILWVARTTAGWPGATALVPAMPVAGLALITAGGLWLCLWRERWRLFALPVIAAGLVSSLWGERPDILVSDDGGLVAVRGADGALSLSSARAERYAAGIWLRREGMAEPGPPWPRIGRSADGRLTCDALGCLYRKEGQTVAILRDPQAVEEDCAGAVAIVAETAVRRCRAPVVVDSRALRRDGAHALFLSPAGARATTVRSTRGDRPWTGW